MRKLEALIELIGGILADVRAEVPRVLGDEVTTVRQTHATAVLRAELVATQGRIAIMLPGLSRQPQTAALAKECREVLDGTAQAFIKLGVR